MTMKRGFRWLLSFAVMAVAAGVFFSYTYRQNSDRVKAVVFQAVDDMILEPEAKEQIKRDLDAVHKKAFWDAWNLSAKPGRKFNFDRYIETVFDHVIEKARSEGNDTLADALEEQRHHSHFSITEK